MKIWYISDVDKASNRTSRVYYYAQKFIKKNCNFFLSTSSYDKWSKENHNSKKNFKFEIINKINVIFIKSFKHNSQFLRSISLLNICLKTYFLSHKLNKVDIIISSQPSLIAYIAMLIAKKRKIPFVYEIRDFWPHCLVHDKLISKTSVIFFILKKIEITLYKNANLIVTNLTNIKKYIDKKSKKKILYIPNPQVTKKKLSFEQNLKLYKNFKKKFTIIYAGGFSKAHNVQLLLRALVYLKKKIIFKVILIGEGSEKNYCKEIIKKNDLNSYVKVLSHIPRNKITNIIMKSHLCIATTASNSTYKYGISLNKLTEYMGCAKPIIITAKGHSNPVLKSKCGYCSKSNSPKDLANKIIKIYKLSITQISQKGINGYKYSNYNFNYNKLSNKYYSKLESLILNK